jgi:hypothetical protein
MRRIARDIPELIARLREEEAKQSDFVVPAPLLALAADERGGVSAKFLTREAQRVERGIQKQAHEQIAERVGVPLSYYERMKETSPELLAANANFWLRRMSDRKYLVRCSGDEVRAVVSNRYRPISHLDLLTEAVRVIAGRDGEEGRERPWARGARCFTWSLSASRLDVCLLNPGTVVDLQDLGAGVRVVQGGISADPHAWTRAAGGGHGVFPAARIQNSETGRGGLYVQSGIFEAVCSNSAWLPANLAQRHLGAELDEEDELSAETYRKMNAALYSKVADIMRAVFEPERFLESCRRLRGLQEVRMEVTEAADRIAKLPGMTEGIRDEILAAYRPLREGARTLLDVQRAVTWAAVEMHNRGERERGFRLEEIGGALIEEGVGALAGAGAGQ